jgi:hypothetical protein
MPPLMLTCAPILFIFMDQTISGVYLVCLSVGLATTEWRRTLEKRRKKEGGRNSTPQLQLRKRARKGGENSPSLEPFPGSKTTKIYKENNKQGQRLHENRKAVG